MAETQEVEKVRRGDRVEFVGGVVRVTARRRVRWVSISEEDGSNRFDGFSGTCPLCSGAVFVSTDSDGDVVECKGRTCEEGHAVEVIEYGVDDALIEFTGEFKKREV